MEKYYRQVEACHHRPLQRLLAFLGLNPTGHGWSGWLPIERAVPRTAVLDGALTVMIADSALGELFGSRNVITSFERFVGRQGDPNDRRALALSLEGDEIHPP